jgi:16S rRNA C967 or C1407 C5-methylase (RsmB/RsmF family)
LVEPGEKAERACFGGYSRYVMDSASIRAAEALGVRPGDRVLDACAAPGGKTLVLLEALQGKGELVANELSSARRFRLKQVIEDHVPSELREQVTVTAYDANRFGLKKEGYFDRVLLDAPCSSEAHLLAEDPEQVGWKESRTRQLAMRQYSLLCSALLSVKPGGVVVYSTCSISPLENDGVIERLLRKKADSVRVDEDSFVDSGFERTGCGVQIFPDRFPGRGPIYWSRLIRI